MKILTYTLPFLLTISCTSKKNVATQTQTFTGFAGHSKKGAILVIDDSTFYYVDGLYEWGETLYDQKIVVEGVVEEHEDTTTYPEGWEVQRIVGKWNLITNPRYRLESDTVWYYPEVNTN